MLFIKERNPSLITDWFHSRKTLCLKEHSIIYCFFWYLNILYHSLFDLIMTLAKTSKRQQIFNMLLRNVLAQFLSLNWENNEHRKNDTKTVWRIFLSPALCENVNKHCNGFSILIGCLHLTIIRFSLFIGLFQRAKIHLNPPNSPFYPVKCATMPDKVMIIH